MGESNILNDFEVSISWVWLISDTFLLVFSLTVLVYVVGCYKRREWFIIAIPSLMLISAAMVAPKDIKRLISPTEFEKVNELKSLPYIASCWIMELGQWYFSIQYLKTSLTLPKLFN